MGDSDLSRVTVAVPFVRVDASQNPNLHVEGNSDPAAPYFRAMVVAFASLRRMHRDLRLELVTNSAPPENFAADLATLDVVVVEIPFAHQPPAGFTSRFAASLYMLDALAEANADLTVYIDPDVVCVNSLETMLARRSVGAIAMHGYTPSHNINGLTRQQAGELHRMLGEPPMNAPVHFGGEVYVFPREHVGRVRERSEAAWRLALARHESGQTKFTTEEHILSYAFRGAEVHELNAYAARIWTARSYRNVTGNERELALWHLPAEKDRGFASAYAGYKAGAWPIDASSFIDWMGREMGVFNRSPKRLAIDTVGQVVGRGRKLLKKQY